MKNLLLPMVAIFMSLGMISCGSEADDCSDLGQKANEIQGEIGLDDPSPDQCVRYKAALKAYRASCFGETSAEFDAYWPSNLIGMECQ